MKLSWLSLLDANGRQCWNGADGDLLFTIRRCGPNASRVALRVNGTVVGIYSDFSDAKHEAEILADMNRQSEEEIG